MSVLAAPLSLGDPRQGGIADVEALVRKVARDRLHQWGARLSDLKREELVSYLIGVCWELSRRYDPAKDKHPNLAAYAARICSLRVADWYRSEFGDTRHGDRPVVLSLDAPAALGANDTDETADRLVDTLVASTGDPAHDRSPDLVGILNGGRGVGAEAHAALGEPPAGGAAGGDRRATALSLAVPARSKKKPRIAGTRRAPSRPPLCGDCFNTFLTAFHKVNQKTPVERRLTAAQLEDKAARRSRAVKFGDVWACPRHTKLEDEKGQKLMLAEAYPNRLTRREAAKQAKRSSKRTAR